MVNSRLRFSGVRDTDQLKAAVCRIRLRTVGGIAADKCGRYNRSRVNEFDVCVCVCVCVCLSSARSEPEEKAKEREREEKRVVNGRCTYKLAADLAWHT